MTIQALRNKLEQQKGQLFQIQKSLAEVKVQLQEKNRSLIRHERARAITISYS
jgi:hypothetical protein